MPAVDRVEQLHAAALHPEHADAIADLRPFGIEIGCDEFVAQLAHVELAVSDMAPVDRSAARQGDRAGQLHRLAREEAQMLGRLVAVRAACRTAARRR